MKRISRKTIFNLLLCGIVIVAALPGTALAASRLAQATDTPTSTATPTATLTPTSTTSPLASISNIEPSSMRSDLGGTLTVLGAGFQTSAVVRVVGVGVLETTFVNVGTLTAQVPVGLDNGNYIVEVINTPGQILTAPSQLKINPPPAPPAPTNPPGPAPFVRPLLAVNSYATDPGTVSQGKGFVLNVALKNVGDDTAFNIALTIPAGDFVPLGNGGTQVVSRLAPGEVAVVSQQMTAKSGIGGGLKSIELSLAYNDRNGSGFTDSPSVAVSVAGGGGVAATATPTPMPEVPQMVVSSYRTDPGELSPGSAFTLTLNIDNVGSVNATRLSAVLGGAASSGTTTDGDTPPGGVSGGGGDFATFGPLGSSNVKFIPLAAITETVTIQQRLIVNSTAKPGAYTVKVSLVYDDQKGQRRVDDQVVTLLVLQPPLLEISYYRPIDPAFVGQPWNAPVQVVNVGRITSQLGNLQVTGPQGVDVQNGTIFVGPLEAGGQFPLDALIFPTEAGTLSFNVNVYYIDDFNEAKVISHTLEVEVLPAPEPEPIDPGGEGGEPSPPPPSEESFFDMLWRAFLGFVGLDSAQPQAAQGGIDSPGEGGFVPEPGVFGP